MPSALSIPEDIARAPYWIVRVYALAFNRALIDERDDPDDDARRALGELAAIKPINLMTTLTTRNSPRRRRT